MDIGSVVELIVDRGRDLERGILGKRFGRYLDNRRFKGCRDSLSSYLQRIESIHDGGLIPYEYSSQNPISIFFTAQALSNLLDMEMEDADITEKIVMGLLEKQDDDGYWTDHPSVKSIDNLPVWQDPANGSVKIFNTSMVLSVLARIHIYDIEENFARGMDIIEKTISDNGVVPGFPQSSWVLTPAIARKYGLMSSRFLLHWSLLDNFLDDISIIGNIISIARGLTLSNIEQEDPLLKKCIANIEDNLQVKDRYSGWASDGNNPNPSISLGALLVLDYGYEL